MEQMIVTIKNGSVEIEIEGVKGVRCVQLTQIIEKLMGEVEGRLLKKDFYINKKIKQNLYLKQFNKDRSL